MSQTPQGRDWMVQDPDGQWRPRQSGNMQQMYAPTYAGGVPLAPVPTGFPAFQGYGNDGRLAQTVSPAGFASWGTQQSVPVIVQSATPNTSPIVPPLSNVTEPAYSLSARDLLEISAPHLPTQGSGQASNSSTSNSFYANIGSLTLLAYPDDLAGYYNLDLTHLYHPVQVDRTLDISVEADAIRACHSYIVGPVNMVLANNPYSLQGQSYPIRSISEDVHSKTVQVGNNYVLHVTRVDLSWQVSLASGWHTFAIVEFKRPKALHQADWAPAMCGQGPVRDQGKKICRQLVKYGMHYGVRFVAACTWDAMILLRLGGDPNNWYGAVGAGAIPAEYQWINSQTDMKRHLFVFLRNALRVFLCEKVGVQVA